jgi:DNA-directed RNA polymerase specialized sigma subunit
MTAAEWLLYNILELKFIQGMRVRDIAHRLAMSESDLYRKQRVAIEEVARSLAEMEKTRAELSKG